MFNLHKCVSLMEYLAVIKSGLTRVQRFKAQSEKRKHGNESYRVWKFTMIGLLFLRMGLILWSESHNN